jgi:hypothetical protein
MTPTEVLALHTHIHSRAHTRTQVHTSLSLIITKLFRVLINLIFTLKDLQNHIPISLSCVLPPSPSMWNIRLSRMTDVIRDAQMILRLLAFVADEIIVIAVLYSTHFHVYKGHAGTLGTTLFTLLS